MFRARSENASRRHRRPRRGCLHSLHRTHRQATGSHALVEQGDVYVLPGESGLRAVLVLRPDGQGVFVENVAVHPTF